MEQIEAGNVAVKADHGQFEAAFEQLEQSIERSTKKIEASLIRMTGTLEIQLGRLETKLDITGKHLGALAAKSEDAANSFGRLVEAIGQLTGIKPIEGAGKIISVLPGESDDQKALLGFSKQGASQLLDGFKSLEGQIASLKSGGDQVGAQDAIARIRREQELILSALKIKANAFQSQIDALKGIASNPGISETSLAIQNYEKSLQTIREVFKEIREFATSPELQKLIDSIRPVLDRSPRQTGALGTSPRTLQFAGLGTDDADAAGSSLLRLGGHAEDAARGFLELNQEAGRFEALGGLLVERLIQNNALLGEQSGLLGQLTAQAPVLGDELGTLFEAGAQEGRVFAEVTDALGASLRDAFDGAIERGESFSDVLKGLALDMAEIALKAAGNAVLESILGGLLGGIGGGNPNAFGGGGVAGAFDASTFGDSGFSPSFAKGGAFSGGRSIAAFASGGALTNRILRRPTLFPLADGIGLAGEAGPEAILPLTRMSSGELGVKAALTRLPAAQAPAGMTVFIDARGADREGLARVERKVHELRGDLIRVNQSIEPRALRAWLETRRRGGFR